MNECIPNNSNLSNPKESAQSGFLASIFLSLLEAMLANVEKGALSPESCLSVLKDWKNALQQKQPSAELASRIWSEIVPLLRHTDFLQGENGEHSVFVEELLGEIERFSRQAESHAKGLEGSERALFDSALASYEWSESSSSDQMDYLQLDNPSSDSHRFYDDEHSGELGEANRQLLKEEPHPSLATHTDLVAAASPLTDFLPVDESGLRETSDHDRSLDSIGLDYESVMMDTNDSVPFPNIQQNNRYKHTEDYASFSSYASPGSNEYPEPSQKVTRAPNQSPRRTSTVPRFSAVQKPTNPGRALGRNQKFTRKRKPYRLDYRGLMGLEAIANLGQVASTVDNNRFKIITDENHFEVLLESWCKIHDYKIESLDHDGRSLTFIIESIQ